MQINNIYCIYLNCLFRKHRPLAAKLASVFLKFFKSSFIYLQLFLFSGHTSEIRTYEGIFNGSTEDNELSFIEIFHQGCVDFAHCFPRLFHSNFVAKNLPNYWYVFTFHKTHSILNTIEPWLKLSTRMQSSGLSFSIVSRLYWVCCVTKKYFL